MTLVSVVIVVTLLSYDILVLIVAIVKCKESVLLLLLLSIVFNLN